MDLLFGLWNRLTRGARRIVATPEWEACAGPELAGTIMTVPVTDRLHAKQGRSTGRLVLGEGAARRAVYLKRHYRLPWLHRILAMLWPCGDWSPAMIEYRNLRWASSQGLRVPEPVAAGEFIGPRLQLQSFLAIEELREMLPLHEAIPMAREQLPPRVFERWKHRLIAEIARMTRILHGVRRFHKDLYLCHFFIARTDVGSTRPLHGCVYLIDLHRLARHRWLGWHYRVKDLAALLFSADLPGVTERDRLRFFRHYYGRPDRGGGKLFAAVSRKADKYRRHNDKHPALAPERTARRKARAS